MTSVGKHNLVHFLSSDGLFAGASARLDRYFAAPAALEVLFPAFPVTAGQVKDGGGLMNKNDLIKKYRNQARREP